MTTTKDPVVKYYEWCESVSPSFNKQTFLAEISSICSSNSITDEDLVQILTSTLPSLAKGSLKRSEISSALSEALKTRQKAFKILWQEALRRTCQIWSVPEDQLFFYILLCDFYLVDPSLGQEEQLCLGLERCEGKTRPTEGASKFIEIFKNENHREKLEKAVLSNLPLSNKSKSLHAIANYLVIKELPITKFVNAYAEAVFTSKMHPDEDAKKTTWAMSPILKSLTTEQVASLLSATVGRALRLTTEKSLPASILLCESLCCNNLPEEAMLLPSVKALKTSSKENVQDMSAQLVSLCLLKSSTTSSMTVLKELCTDLPSESSVHRRLKIVKALSTATPHADLATSQQVTSVLLRRAKDEKVEDVRNACLEASIAWITKNLKQDQTTNEMESVLKSICPQSLVGIRVISSVAKNMKIQNNSVVEDICKELSKIVSDPDSTFQMKLNAANALAAIGKKELIHLIDFSSSNLKNENDLLTLVSILSYFHPQDANAPAKYYTLLGSCLVNSQFLSVRSEAQNIFKLQVSSFGFEKEMMHELCSSSLTLTKFAVETILPEVKEKCDAEHFGLALILCYKCSFKDRKLIWSSIQKNRLPAECSKQDFLSYIAPYLFSSNEMDPDAIACALQVGSTINLHHLDPLISRLDSSVLLELNTEKNLAAYSAPPGRLSDYQLNLLASQLHNENEDEDDDDDKNRTYRQGRKGRGGTRKELYSQETLEWEKKVRAEQKEKNKGQIVVVQQKSSVEVEALKMEEEIRNMIKAKAQYFDNAARVIVAISDAVPHVAHALSNKVLPNALSLKQSPFVRISANSILDAYLSLIFLQDTRLDPDLKPRLRNESKSALISLNEIYEDTLKPFSQDLFELMFPIMLNFISSHDKEEMDDEVTDAMFNLISVHHTMIKKEKREQLLTGLLKVVSNTPLPSSSKCLVSLFLTESPTEKELDILIGDNGLLNQEPMVRYVALCALDHCPSLASKYANFVWFACSDMIQKNREVAELLSTRTPIDKQFYQTLASLLGHPDTFVRLQAARAIASGIDEHPDEAGNIVSFLISSYSSVMAVAKAAASTEKVAPKFFDREAKANLGEEDTLWYKRSGVSFTLAAFAGMQVEKINAEEIGLPSLGPVLEPQEAMTSIEFVLSDGTRDPNPTVRGQMINAGTALVQAYGTELGEAVLQLIQAYLSGSKSDLKLSHFEMDTQREGAVIMLGAAASNLHVDDERVPDIAEKLVSTLSTPSESVQRAVVKIIPQLLKSSKFKIENGGDGGKELVEKSLSTALSPLSSFGSRKGHAMGLAALIKGLGISSLKQFSLVPRLTEASLSDKWETRQGSLLCFDELTSSLGRLFEPYIVQIVEPVLLKSFSDVQVDVREAAHDASKTVMANLSGPGVSMLLPKLLSGIASSEWRTKHAAIVMLGSVAFCAPKQLASALPQVVPKLIDAFTDTHPKVRSGAVSALKDVQSVVKNPEIEKISTTLISALTDPHERTSEAVDVLFQTRFVHAVDAPSLSLLVPILRRGLKERSTETKKRSALVVGHMISMISDAKTVKPYLEDILPVLRVVLVDPIPGVRGTAAKAIGTLVRGLGEEGIPDFPGLFQFLIDTMLEGASSVERQGGAQGYVEVLVALQNEKALENGLTKQIFDMTNETASSSAREGALWGLVFLPNALENLSKYGERALGCALRSLSDDSEPVRDAALRCARVYVSQFTSSEPAVVLAALMGGMNNINWRVKQTSVRLLGDFITTLLKTFGDSGAVFATPVTGIPSNENEFDENDEEESEDEIQPEDVTQEVASDGPADMILLKLFGLEKREKLIATLYLLRNDGSAQVRQNALFVWKTLVSNTPRTMRRIIKPLMTNIIQLLSSVDTERQRIGGRALADVVKKLGDRVLPEIVPVILAGFDSPVEEERIGVAMGLHEMVGATSRSSIEPQSEAVLKAIQKGLCDQNNRVRDLAGKSFNRVHVLLGATVDGPAITYILTKLSNSLSDDEERSIRGLTQAVESRSRDGLSFLLPKLLAKPLVPANIRALGSCMKVVPTHLHHYLRNILRVFVEYLASENLGPPFESDSEIWLAAADSVSNSVYEEQSVSTLIIELSDITQNSPDSSQRRAAMAILSSFLSGTENLISPDLSAAVALKSTIRQFAENDANALSQACSAFAALIKHVGVANMTDNLDFVRNSVRTVSSGEKYRAGGTGSKENYELPAFTVKICTDALLDLYQYALMNGSNEERQSAAEGLGEFVDLTSADTLKPYVVKITGPLIRIVGDRFPSPVKKAILTTLGKLLSQGGAVLRPFLPQLQTTFVKAIQNSNEEVRLCGSRALEIVVPLLPRVDPLCSELILSCTSADAGVRLQMVKSLYFLLNTRAQDLTVQGLTKIFESTSPIDSCVTDWQDGYVRAISAAVEAKALSSMLQNSDQEQFRNLFDLMIERINKRLSQCESSESWQTRHGALLTLNACLRLPKGAEFLSNNGIETFRLVESATHDEAPSVRAVACDTAGWAIIASEKFMKNQNLMKELLQQASSNDADDVVRSIASSCLKKKQPNYEKALDSMENELGGF